MEWDFMFFLNSALLGVGLAMDAFSVSLANGLHEPNMKKSKTCGIAGTFAIFQAAMPLIGYFCVIGLESVISWFSKITPFVSLVLLGFIGGKMLYEGIKNKDGEEEAIKLGFGALLVQGIATSIDALSVGFTIAHYSIWQAIVCALIIAAVTFAICIIGLFIGKKFGTKLANKATIFGGALLILIGIEIFITGII